MMVGLLAMHEHELGWILYKDRRGKQTRTKLHSSHHTGVIRVHCTTYRLALPTDDH